MAVTLTGEVLLPAARATVWRRLNDPETLKASIPGCESLDKISDCEFGAVARVKIGPVNARFKGKVTLSEVNVPDSYRISGEGDGGVSGFAKGGAYVRLMDADGGGTRLSYDVEARVGGKLAQLGGRLIASTAKKIADEFFANFARALNEAGRE
jgi:carbon monoxide dehydrogenase subunit G